MKNNVEPNSLSQLDAVFAQLTPRAVEEFYAAYQQWTVQQRMRELRQRIDTVRAQGEENEQRIQQTRPSAISLAALARLQSNGVSDMALLDALLERGEAWLDQTMQRLDYFEQFDDFIADDYTQWCQGALEGAFDWIDSLRDSAEQEAPLPLEVSPEEMPPNSEDDGDVEALLLQRLAIEDKEDNLSWQDAITLKRTAIQVPTEETAAAAPAEEQERAAYEEATSPEAALQVTEHIPPDEFVASDETPIDSFADNTSSAEEQILPEEVLPVEDIDSQGIVSLGEAQAAGEAQREIVGEVQTNNIGEAQAAGEAQTGEREGDRKGPHPALPNPRLYNEDENDSPGSFIVEAGDDVEGGGDPRGRLRTLSNSEKASEDTIDQVSEQTTSPEIAIPDDIPALEDISQGEVSEPGEIENDISEEVTQHEYQAIATDEPVTPVRRTPPKRGFIRQLIWIFTGK